MTRVSFLKRILSIVRNGSIVLENEAASDWFSYSSIIVSYPRSGSNFLQQILRDNSDLKTSSLYGSASNVREADNLKSHAISHEYLQAELSLITGRYDQNVKILVLFRDPRDVMISFYNYAIARKIIDVPHNQFLDLDWFLIFGYSQSTRVHMRRHHLTPISVGDAYQIFVNSWLKVFNESPMQNIILCKYEDIMANFDEEARRLLQFFKTDLDPPSRFKDRVKKPTQLVALYSQEERPRGEAFGSQRAEIRDQYSKLVASVEERFDNEIRLLGYDR